MHFMFVLAFETSFSFAQTMYLGFQKARSNVFLDICKYVTLW